MKPRTRLLLALSACLLASGVAMGQDLNDVARTDLIRRAQAASSSGDHTTAVDLARRASQIRMTPSLRAFYASELKETGKYLDAVAQGETCLREVASDPTLPGRAQVQQLCQNTVTAARGRLGSVMVVLPSPLPAGLKVVVNGSEVVPALYGLPVPVDPGPVVVVATATGESEFRGQATVQSQATANVVVRFGSRGAEPVILRTTTPTTNTTSTTETTTTRTDNTTEPRPMAPERPAETLTPLQIAGVVVGVAGGAALGAGIGSGIAYLTRSGGVYNDCTMQNGRYLCPESSRSNVQELETLGTVFIAASIVGVVLVGAAMPMRFAGGRAAPRVAVVPTPSGLALTVGGSF